MNKIVVSSLAILLSSTLMANGVDNMAVKKEGIGYIKMLGMTLKSELKAKMKADKSGMGALGFCSAKAEQITKDVNAKLPSYAKVRRTSLKLRNPNNKADEVDIKVMNEYVSAIENSTFTPKDIKVVKVGDTTRVYKPLTIKPVCLKCHGSNLAKNISEAIKASYPNDKAIGYKDGELRGVVVAEIKEKR
jgi:hypothetical protein